MEHCVMVSFPGCHPLSKVFSSRVSTYAVDGMTVELTWDDGRADRGLRLARLHHRVFSEVVTFFLTGENPRNILTIS